MNHIVMLRAAVFLTALCLARPAFADYSDRVAAFEKGDHATALKDTEAAEGYRMAAEQGPSRAQYEQYELDLTRELAEQGDGDAQFELGIMYARGQSVPQDYVEAAKWLTKAAEQGHARAQFNLGDMYRQGLGVPQDYKEAEKWYRVSAEQGHASAQFSLGIMYGTGDGVQQDYAEAEKWLTEAAKGGEPEAVKWLTDVAKGGDARAQYILGDIYTKGVGVGRNAWRAAEWYRLAARQGLEGPFRWHDIELAPATWKTGCQKPDRPLTCFIVFRATWRLPDNFDNPAYTPANDDEPPLAFSMWIGFDKRNTDLLISVNMDRGLVDPEHKTGKRPYGVTVSYKANGVVHESDNCYFGSEDENFPRGALQCRFENPLPHIVQKLGIPDTWNEDDTLSFSFSLQDTKALVFAFRVPVNESRFKPLFERTILEAPQREEERERAARKPYVSILDRVTVNDPLDWGTSSKNNCDNKRTEKARIACALGDDESSIVMMDKKGNIEGCPPRYPTNIQEAFEEELQKARSCAGIQSSYCDAFRTSEPDWYGKTAAKFYSCREPSTGNFLMSMGEGLCKASVVKPSDKADCSYRFGAVTNPF